MIIITSKKEGFRRCGVAHSASPTEYQDVHFTDQELEDLRAEPMLVVQEEDEEKAELSNKPTPASDMIALVKKASTLDELHKLADGETRKTVIEAIAARWKELEA